MTNESEQTFPWPRLVMGLSGAVVGAVLGALIYRWGIGQGFDAAVVPGAAVGFGFATAARNGRTEFGLLCAAIALVLSLYLEWTHFPFVADDSLGYFLTHLHKLQPMKILMILVGLVMAFTIGRGTSR